MDMELVQFHPTGMVAPEEAAGPLVTEAVRGEGGHLYNVTTSASWRVYDPERMELSTRDRVALANYTEIAEGRGGPHGGVFLDITHPARTSSYASSPACTDSSSSTRCSTSPANGWRSHRPRTTRWAASWWSPTHATEVVGLYAAGECTAGLHGANRLGRELAHRDDRLREAGR